MEKIISLLFTLLFSIASYSQQNETLLREKVLKKGIINKTFTFGKWDEKGDDELKLTYLGILKNESESYKIITSLWIWGTSKRATSRILVYNSKNKFIGDYYLTMIYELPKYIKNNKLFFDINDTNCKGKTEISFGKGIPEHLIINCNQSTMLIGEFSKN